MINIMQYINLWIFVPLRLCGPKFFCHKSACRQAGTQKLQDKQRFTKRYSKSNS